MIIYAVTALAFAGLVQANRFLPKNRKPHPTIHAAYDQAIRADVYRYVEPGCQGQDPPRIDAMDQNVCAAWAEFRSVQLWPRLGNKEPIGARNCSLYIYESEDCNGTAIWLGDIRDIPGLCQSTLFHHNRDPTGVAARAGRWQCEPDQFIRFYAANAPWEPGAPAVSMKVPPPAPSQTPEPEVDQISLPVVHWPSDQRS
jgi:hypothetical protein